MRCWQNHLFLLILRWGVFSISHFTKIAIAHSAATGLLLIPMAGMAIGLVSTTTTLVPEMGDKVATLVFAMVAIFETIGPFAAAHAFRMSGEAEKVDYDVSEDEVDDVNLDED